MPKPSHEVMNFWDPASDSLSQITQAMPAKAAQIATAAAEIFMQSGYEAASMDEIARRAQVSKATVYAHFKSKSELFGSLMRGVTEVRISALFESGVPQNDVRATLEVIFERIINIMLTPPALGLYRVIVAESARFPELGDAYYRAGPALVIQRLAQLLSAWHEAGLIAIDQPRAIAELLYGALRNDLQMRRLLGVGPIEGASEDPRAIARRLIGFFLAACAKPPLKPA